MRILDPMCGKGTTLMCALCENCDAVGVDTDAKAIREAESYLERSLKLHRIKHRRASGALTLPVAKVPDGANTPLRRMRKSCAQARFPFG